MTENRAYHTRTARNGIRLDGCERCHYCGLTFGTFYHEHDHAPVPSCAGGTSKVPTCVTCHDIKDRFKFENWPVCEVVPALQSLLALGIMPTRGSGQVPASFWPEQWVDLGLWERLLWAWATQRQHEESMLT